MHRGSPQTEGGKVPTVYTILLPVNDNEDYTTEARHLDWIEKQISLYGGRINRLPSTKIFRADLNGKVYETRVIPIEIIAASASASPNWCVVIASKIAQRLSRRQVFVLMRQSYMPDDNDVHILSPEEQGDWQIYPSSEANIGTLTPREIEVLRLIAKGLSNRQIAEGIGRSRHTIENHAHNIYVKLQVENRTEATYVALRAGLVTDEIDETIHDEQLPI